MPVLRQFACPTRPGGSRPAGLGLRGAAGRIDTTGRKSAEWGQPWLTKYLYWKRQARERAAGGAGAAPRG